MTPSVGATRWLPSSQVFCSTEQPGSTTASTMAAENTNEVTVLLKAMSDGDGLALEKLTPLVFAELHRIARKRFFGERDNHTLQPTALVNEAYLNLIEIDASWQSRAHFFALASRLMRNILVNHAKARTAEKRGGGDPGVTLNEEALGAAWNAVDVLAVERALEGLKATDERKAQILELSIFGGLTYAEMAEVTGLSTSTLDRELRFAKAWLQREISERP